MEQKPVTQKEAFAFIKDHHRHHNVPVGWLWGHGVVDDEDPSKLLGICVVGRPVARALQDGYTFEVTRLATLGGRNCCSLLYSAAARAAKAKGYRRGITYILHTEPGVTLRAANWKKLWDVKGRSWTTPSRPRTDPNPTCDKQAWGWGDWEELVG